MRDAAMRRQGQGRALGLALLLCAGAPAAAAITGSGPDGFTVVHERTVAAAPAAAWAMLVAPAQWWNGAHSYSGNAANLTLDLRAGGCWCERWAGGSAEHGRVILVAPERTLRLYAALGPLQQLPTVATLSWTLAAAGQGTKIVLTYRVLGRASDNIAAMAAPVDAVLAEQADRLAAALGGKTSR